MRRFLSVILSLTLLLGMCAGFTVHADESKTCTVTIGKVSANVGDLVYVPVSITDNPGLTAVTATFTYDSAALEYTGFDNGLVFTDSILVKEHPDQNLIKMAVCEFSKDTVNNDNILIFKFRVKEKADASFHPMEVKYTNGDFANHNGKIITPKFVSGGVDVAYSKEADNCSHKEYGDWVVVSKGTCTESGAKQRACKKCGHKETKETPPFGHVYEENWTVDTVATAKHSGTMSRHCKYCTSTVDSITYTLDDASDKKLDNSFGATQDGNKAEDLFHKQNPGESLTPTSPGYTPPADSSASSQTGSSGAVVTSKPSLTDKIKDNIKQEIDDKIDEAIEKVSPDSAPNMRVQMIEKIKAVYPKVETFFEWVIFGLFVLFIF